MATTLSEAFVNAGYEPVKLRKPRERKIQKCRKCGSSMIYIENSNVMVCSDEAEVECSNRYIFETHGESKKFDV